MGRPSWSEVDLRVLRDNWPAKTSGEIAEMVGKSRGAVMGMIRRLGLESKTPSGNPRPDNPNPRKRPYTSTIRKLKAKPKVTVVEIPSAPIPLLKAAPNQCRAIVDGAKDDDGLAVVCGKPVVCGQPFSFCSEHLKQYTTQGGYRNVGHQRNFKPIQ